MKRTSAHEQRRAPTGAQRSCCEGLGIHFQGPTELIVLLLIPWHLNPFLAKCLRGHHRHQPEYGISRHSIILLHAPSLGRQGGPCA